MSHKRKASDGSVVVRGSKMAKDKSIFEVNQALALSSGVATVNVSVNPYAADANAGSTINRPLTVSGLRWRMSAGNGGMTANSNQRYKWCLWVRRKNQTIPSTAVIAAGPPADAFSSIDENNILVWGSGLGGSQYCATWEGATKTQRKMQVGDQLVLSFAAAGTGTDSVAVYGVFQTFYKS